MIKDYFIGITKAAIDKAVADKKLGEMTEFDGILICEKPKNIEFGDFAINVSSLARSAKMAPPLIGKEIISYIEQNNFEVSLAGGFINFKVGNAFLNGILADIADKKENYGRQNIGEGKKVNLEYVSANPTGPFHIGHGRWAAVGSSLAESMKFAGYDVFQEFYINDAGNQIQKLGKSLELRVKEQKGETIEMPEDSYRGDYLIETAKEYIKENSTENYADYAKRKMLENQKELLEKFGVHFDLFFSELSLYANNEVEAAIKALEPYMFEQDGATWFKTTQFGDDQDRVIKKADGNNTYLTADIAYHMNKLKRCDEMINIWGADHHGYIPRIKAAIQALGGNPDALTVILGQLVNIVQDGMAVRMGKRKTMVTLDDLIEEVGVDGVRFWMLMRSTDTTLDFDVDLAKSQSDKNPVFYVQYAHARCASILRRATDVRIDTVDKKELPPHLSQSEFVNAKRAGDINLANIDAKSALYLKKLILKLEEFNEVIASVAKNKAPYLLCKYALELAGDFHQFYNFTRVLSDDKETTKAMVFTVAQTKIVMANVLKLIGVSAPEKM